MKNKMMMILLIGTITLATIGCGKNSSDNSGSDDTTITIFAAKSLNGVVDELIEIYNANNPDIEILTNYESSGTLMEAIEKGGAECDVFFSAAQKQMDQLEESELVVDGTRANVVNNQVCVVTYVNSGTNVTGLDSIGEAKSIALADGSVPVGKYTRQALVNKGMIQNAKDVSDITTQAISDALGNIEINECINVGAVTTAVVEASNEVGTVYKSDTYGLEDELMILEIIDYEYTGNVIYPIAQIVNESANKEQNAAAMDFINFLTSEAAKPIYEKYYFDTKVD